MHSDCRHNPPDGRPRKISAVANSRTADKLRYRKRRRGALIVTSPSLWHIGAVLSSRSHQRQYPQRSRELSGLSKGLGGPGMVRSQASVPRGACANHDRANLPGVSGVCSPRAPRSSREDPFRTRSCNRRTRVLPRQSPGLLRDASGATEGASLRSPHRGRSSNLGAAIEVCLCFQKAESEAPETGGGRVPS